MQLDEFKLHIPPTTLNIARNLMPQIQSKDVPEFLEELKHKGIKVKETKVRVDQLKTVQGEFNHHKVHALMTQSVSKAKPIIISQDNYVVDGNHRWLAELNKNKLSKIDAVIINLNIMDLIQQARLFNKVFYKQVHEQKVHRLKRLVKESYNTRKQ